MVNYQEIEKFTTAIQAIFPKLMHYLQTEESRELAGLGITPAQVNALLVLYVNDDLTMGQLSSELYLAESAVTRLVNRLVKLDLVRRKGDERDRRVVRVSLKSYGKQLAGVVFERRNTRFGNLANQMTPNEREMLILSLQSVLKGFETLEGLASKKREKEENMLPEKMKPKEEKQKD